MTAEKIAFSDLFDCAFILAIELRKLLTRFRIPVKLSTDNKSLLDITSKAREGFAAEVISNIGFLHSSVA